MILTKNRGRDTLLLTTRWLIPSAAPCLCGTRAAHASACTAEACAFSPPASAATRAPLLPGSRFLGYLHSCTASPASSKSARHPQKAGPRAPIVPFARTHPPAVRVRGNNRIFGPRRPRALGLESRLPNRSAPASTALVYKMCTEKRHAHRSRGLTPRALS